MSSLNAVIRAAINRGEPLPNELARRLLDQRDRYFKALGDAEHELKMIRESELLYPSTAARLGRLYEHLYGHADNAP